MALLKYKVLYDDQCEICQAGVSWLKLLDRRHETDCIPIDPESLNQLSPSLNLDDCLRELHVLTPDGRIYIGWNGVALLARQFPTTWIIGALGCLPPFRWLGRMRSSLQHHFSRGMPKIYQIAATHHHEEHVGNLNWLSEQRGEIPIYVREDTAKLLQPPQKLPWIRALMIGQTPPLKKPFQFLGDQIRTASGTLQVIPTPGHCADHASFYDPTEKLLLAGDTFMGTYFAAPNPDVDSRVWLQTLERLMELDIEIMVEGHGHIHTLRQDIPNIPGVVIRENPKEALRRKLESMRWIRKQIEEGLREGLPFRVVEATCFPWRQSRTWENFLNDEMIRLLSLGHFSRSELVRSFVRDPKTDQIFPQVYQISFYNKDGS